MMLCAGGCASVSSPDASAAATSPSPRAVALVHEPNSLPRLKTLPLPALSLPAASVEAARLQAAFAREVHDAVPETAATGQRWMMLARTMLAEHGEAIDRAQLVVVVDPNPHVQKLALLVALPSAPWLVIGGTHLSTGQPNRHGYYITPTGVFLHDASILDYRAQGTFNENHIRGLGLKGMRVWDFGWQWAVKGWLKTRRRPDTVADARDRSYLSGATDRPTGFGRLRTGYRRTWIGLWIGHRG